MARLPVNRAGFPAPRPSGNVFASRIGVIGESEPRGLDRRPCILTNERVIVLPGRSPLRLASFPLPNPSFPLQDQRFPLRLPSFPLQNGRFPL